MWSQLSAHIQPFLSALARILTIFNNFLWLSLALYGSQGLPLWLPLALSGSLWFSLALSLSLSLCLSLSLSGFLWLSAISHFKLFCFVLQIMCFEGKVFVCILWEETKLKSNVQILSQYTRPSLNPDKI